MSMDWLLNLLRKPRGRTKESVSEGSDGEHGQTSLIDTTILREDSPAQWSRTLDAIASQADLAQGVCKEDLKPGDWVFVTTKNSVYSICALGGDQYSVSGGWFDKEGVSPQVVPIDGCTWGGCAIKSDLVAAKGLFLGFGNSVLTTRIKDVRLIRNEECCSVL